MIPAAAAAIEELVGSGPSARSSGPYDAANQFDRSMALWAPPLQSADADLLPNKAVMDARVRDMQRNDGHIQTGQMLHRDHIVGAMYLLNARPNYKVLGLEEEWAEEFSEEVEAKFMLAAASDDAWFDASRTNDLTALIRLAVGTYTAAGEVLATADWIREAARPFKTAIQMIDVDRLSTPYEKQGIDERVRGGIFQDRRGAPKMYYIRDAHPSDWDRWQDTMTWTAVPARKPWGRKMVFHVKEQMRVDQSRGVALMVAGLKETRIAKKFRDVTLQQAVAAATYATSIESDLPPNEAFAALGGGDMQQSIGGVVTDYAGQYLKAISQYAGNARHLMIDGVKIPHFFPGTRLVVKPVGVPGGVGEEFEASLLRHLSGILGVSYEELSHDYSRTNYSSARAGMLGTWKFMQSQKKIIADGMANFIFTLWLEEQINAGEITSMPRRAPNFYEGLNKEAYTAADWIGAARGQVDELKETQASVLKIKYGLSTHEEELAKNGKDWRKVYAQLERERKEREKRGILLVEDNSINAASGTPSDAQDGGTGSGSGNNSDG